MLLRRGSRGAAVRKLQRRLLDLGYDPGPVDGIFGRRTERAVNRFKRDAGLRRDGLAGPETLALLESPVSREWPRPRRGSPEPRGGWRRCSFGDPPWLTVAQAEIGVREYPGARSNPRIEQYIRSTNAAPHDINDATQWCAAFACWALEQAGYRSPRRLGAKSFLDWGHALAAPRRGAIAVFTRGDYPRTGIGDGHVGFYMGERARSIAVLGGNQDDAVNVRMMPRTRLIAYRWPATAC